MNNIIDGKRHSLLVEILNHLITMNLRRKTLEEFEMMADSWGFLVGNSSNQNIKPRISTNQQLLGNYKTDIIHVATYIVC